MAECATNKAVSCSYICHHLYSTRYKASTNFINHLVLKIISYNVLNWAESQPPHSRVSCAFPLSFCTGNDVYILGRHIDITDGCSYSKNIAVGAKTQ